MLNKQYKNNRTFYNRRIQQKFINNQSTEKIHKQIRLIQQKLQKKDSISTGFWKMDLDAELPRFEKYMNQKLQLCNIQETTNQVLYDMGSGVGHKSIALRNQFKKAIGVEPVSEEVDIANLKKKYFQAKNVEFHCCGAEKTPIKTTSVDFVFSETVIEHVNDVKQTLKETHRVMKKRSQFYLACPNYNWIYEGHYHMLMPPLVNKKYFKIFSFLGKQNAKFIDHINYITPKQLKKDLRKEGFVIKKDFSEEKIKDIFIQGNLEPIPKHYNWMKPGIQLVKKIGLLKLIGNWSLKTGFYPAIEMLIEKK
jgi:ubiquinone/menaquinone biosynthesis C-methylase UbiE